MTPTSAAEYIRKEGHAGCRGEDEAPAENYALRSAAKACNVSGSTGLVR